MHSYVILFRGVNVGGKNLLPMKALSSLLELNGYHQVKTYIQSGNVVLLSEHKPGNDLVNLVEQHFGFVAPIIVLTQDEFTLISKNNPYREAEGKFCHFYFCEHAPKLDIEKLLKLTAKSEEYQLIDKVFYLHAPDGVGRSKLVANIEKCLGVTVTGRNLNTINKINLLLESMT
jgi:uncharacterized protein (DUF1697 family)